MPGMHTYHHIMADLPTSRLILKYIHLSKRANLRAGGRQRGNVNPSRGKEGEEWNVCGRISYPYVRPQPLPTHRIDLGHKQNLSLNYSEHTCIQDDIIMN